MHKQPKNHELILTINRCPVPRSNKKRKAISIVISGIVPPLYRMFCDDATKLIKQTVKDSLNAKTVGDMYAGDIEHRGVDYYLERAFDLGKKLDGFVKSPSVPTRQDCASS